MIGPGKQLNHQQMREAFADLSYAAPIPMILHCPNCGYQHIDKPDAGTGWTNPPHKSHLCAACMCVWRPADVPTVGVPKITTQGKDDTWVPPMYCRKCGCTDTDCSECVEVTGDACHWVEPELCSRCADEQERTA